MWSTPLLVAGQQGHDVCAGLLHKHGKTKATEVILAIMEGKGFALLITLGLTKDSEANRLETES